MTTTLHGTRSRVLRTFPANGLPVVDIATYVDDEDYSRVHAWRESAWREVQGFGYGQTPPAPEDIAVLLAAWIADARDFAQCPEPSDWWQRVSPERGPSALGYVRLWTVRPMSEWDTPDFVAGPFMIGPAGERHTPDGPVRYTFSG